MALQIADRVEPKVVRPVHISGFDRERQDFYATPSWVTEALLRHIRFRGPIWEPCCGDGAISKVLLANGYDVVSSDLVERGYGEAGVDFLRARSMPPGCLCIVTNPPYGDPASQADAAVKSSAALRDFLRHAQTLTASVQGQLALLVRLQWISGQRVTQVLSAGPFSAVIVLRKRICWFDRGKDTKQAQHHHAWVVFDHAYPAGKPPVMLYG
jgi:hypothetical protein